MAFFGSPNGQNDPKNTNSKYADQKIPKKCSKIAKNCQKWPFIGSPNGQNDPKNINSKYTDKNNNFRPFLKDGFKNERGLKSDEK